ncbi:hypothetical protein NC653_004955 [Populus alba x Populus x berolinensis]|uniref:Uncharacterized protein n=1 Tax=Populus alba x Populus x berolinensis TaxID=444605 RepID=A0AAD6RAQ1_9ROSI|nr:hypothetical protein NC653_004955 [Populus alba x Populus x berolinensis]
MNHLEKDEKREFIFCCKMIMILPKSFRAYQKRIYVSYRRRLEGERRKLIDDSQMNARHQRKPYA